MRAHGYPVRQNPILDRLDHVENRDALINADGSEADWPVCDAIVGNPPFLGDKKMRSELGDVYTEALRKCYTDRVPGGANLVTYWFEKARARIDMDQYLRAGLVAAQSIRKGESQKVLARICDTTRFFNVWSDEEWVNDGAAVRVSLGCFGNVDGATLNGQPVDSIHADFTAGGGISLTQARPLKENAGMAFIGTQKNGPFDVPGEIARRWLVQPNPNGKPNSDVVRPWVNGQDITTRLSDTWIIDFGSNRAEQDSALYEAPFGYAEVHVKPTRKGNRDPRAGTMWWLHKRSNDDLREALAPVRRFVATSRVAKYRLFVWIDGCVLPDSRLFAIARENDTTFGVLSSRVHAVWALANASIHGDGDEGGRPTYNAKSCFETFPFPAGLTPRDTAPTASQTSPPCLAEQIIAENIGAAARHLNTLRENWLNPPEWVDWVITPEEEKAGFPKRPVAKPGHEAELKKRTLTNLYNVRPAWLDNAHKALDAAVAAAYGWADYAPTMPDEEILRRLLALNLERAGELRQ